MEEPGLQIIICSGPEDARRSTLGFALALAAVASGIAVRIFLTMGGARWALRSEGTRPVAPGFPPIAEMIAAIQSGGGRIVVCSACAGDLEGPAPETGLLGDMHEGILVGGLTSVAVRMGATPTVTF